MFKRRSDFVMVDIALNLIPSKKSNSQKIIIVPELTT